MTANEKDSSHLIYFIFYSESREALMYSVVPIYLCCLYRLLDLSQSKNAIVLLYVFAWPNELSLFISTKSILFTGIMFLIHNVALNRRICKKLRLCFQDWMTSKIFWPMSPAISCRNYIQKDGLTDISWFS